MQKQILIVDDEPAIRDMVAFALRKGDYAPVHAGDAREAQAAIADRVPDLILLDVDLPDMDGREACRLLRKDGVSTPVIMLTAQSADAEAMKARLDLQLAGFKTWFITRNVMEPGRSMDMQLAEGPFKRLHGRWEFKPLSAEASKVSLLLEFETASSLLGPVIRLGMTGLADRMVDDFVRTASAEAA